jgi:hypothetical protein
MVGGATGKVGVGGGGEGEAGLEPVVREGREEGVGEEAGRGS